MECQLYNYYKESVMMCDKETNNENNNENIYYNLIIISLLIYSTITTIIIFIRQPVKVIEEVEVIEEVVTEENNEEELLLANYNTKERAVALQAAYKEQLQVLLEKRKNITIKLNTFTNSRSINKGDGISLSCLCDGDYSQEQITNSLTVNDILVYTILEKMYQSIIKDMVSVDKEILIVSKKAGLFEVTGDLLKDLNVWITPENPIYDDCKNVLLNM